MRAPQTLCRFAGLFLIALALSAVGLRKAEPAQLKLLCAEDGPVESLTALCYCFAAAALGWRAPRPRFARLALAALFIFIGAEELSWGQRLFHLTTPAALARVNVQREITLHNIAGVNHHARLVGVLVLGGLGLALPLAAAGVPAIRGACGRARLPVAPAVVGLAVILSVAFMALPRLCYGRIVPDYDEFGEFLLGVGMLLLGLTATPRCGARAADPPPARTVETLPTDRAVSVPARSPS